MGTIAPFQKGNLYAKSENVPIRAAHLSPKINFIVSAFMKNENNQKSCLKEGLDWR